MRKLLLIAVVVSFMCCESQQNQSLDPCDVYDAIDLEMLNTYDEVMANYKGEDHKSFRKRFSASQVYWIQYRDRFVKALYPDDQEDYRQQDWKTYSRCKCTELTLLTKNRIEELRLWLDGSPSRTNCPTSIKK